MIYTNHNGLPQAIFDWILRYQKINEVLRQASINECEKKFGKKFNLKISATNLIKPLREVILIDRHYEEIRKEASDMFAATIGTAVHKTFEDMPLREGEEREIRVAMDMKDVLVSAQIDNIYGDSITDYKTMGVGQYIFSDKEYEFVAQLAIGRYLYLADKGKELNSVGRILAIFATDWRQSEYDKKKYMGFMDAPNYPFRGAEMFFDLWDYDATEKWLLRKITDYKIASLQTDQNLPECTDKERWAKVGKKKTTYRKCETYCSAAAFCNQWQKEKNK